MAVVFPSDESYFFGRKGNDGYNEVRAMMDRPGNDVNEKKSNDDNKVGRGCGHPL